jgi:hypothetical protein
MVFVNKPTPILGLTQRIGLASRYKVALRCLSITCVDLLRLCYQLQVIFLIITPSSFLLLFSNTSVLHVKMTAKPGQKES